MIRTQDEPYDGLITCEHNNRVCVEKSVGTSGRVLMTNTQNIEVCRECLARYLLGNQVNEILNQF